MNYRDRTIPILGAILTALVVSSCGQQVQRAAPADVTKSEVLVLNKPSGKGSVHCLIIEGSGSIDGKAEIQLMENGAAYRKELLSGPVSFEWSNDWYSDSAEIRYLPSGATGGNLVLKYRFKTM
jgi:hypothetical protein